jgi:5'-3' exonuclease
MLAIIDGDVLAYQACKTRWGNSVHQQGSDIRVIPVDPDGNKIIPEFSREEDTEYRQECWRNFNQDLDRLLNKLYCTDYIMAVKGQGDFRKILYPEYKMNRHKPDAPHRYLNDFVPSIRKLAIFENLAIAANDCEADDLIRIWAEEARAYNQEYIVCSIDKDLRCIPGRHYVMHYDPSKQRILNITEDAAKRFYYEQLLKGDPTDNIPGVPRVGEVKAAKLLAECETEEQMQETVVEQYLLAYGPDEWYHHFLINGKLIHLQTHYNDYFECQKDWPIIKELL